MAIAAVFAKMLSTADIAAGSSGGTLFFDNSHLTTGAWARRGEDVPPFTRAG